MLPLIDAPAVTQIQPARLDAWRWRIDAAGWAWQATSLDRRIEVFTRPVKDTPAPQLLVRIERFDGRWQSQTARVALDCRAGRVSVIEAEAFGGMNLSGEVREAAPSDWTAPEVLLKPVLRSACGS